MTFPRAGRLWVGRGGGILLDLFLIAALTAAGVVVWGMWRKGSLTAMFRDLSRLVPSAPVLLNDRATLETEIDVSDRSARVQSAVREALSRRGVGEKHILRTQNVERREDGIQWLEDTLEIRRPSRFDLGEFLASLEPFLAQERLVLMEDEREGTRRTFAYGDRKRVYQRVIFESSR